MGHPYGVCDGIGSAFIQCWVEIIDFTDSMFALWPDATSPWLSGCGARDIES